MYNYFKVLIFFIFFSNNISKLIFVSIKIILFVRKRVANKSILNFINQKNSHVTNNNLKRLRNLIQLKYSWENKRKFDIIAAMIAAELGDEDLMGYLPTPKNEQKET